MKGYNLLTGENLKLGDWQAYLRMREGMLHMVQEAKGRLSRDLGDIAGLCFEAGIGRMLPPELPAAALQELQTRWEKEAAKRHKEIVEEDRLEREHAEQQARLATLGAAWGYHVWLARNDHGRTWSGGRLGDLSVPELNTPGLPADVRDTVELIDVIWLDAATHDIVAAFEVEKSTSIYSGILRLYDLAMSAPVCQEHLYLVAPNQREKEVVFQLSRPSLAVAQCLRPEYILFEDLVCNCAQMARFGTGLSTLKKVSKRV